MEELLTFLGMSVVLGTVGGLGWFFAERWLERRAAKRAEEQSLLDINTEVSDTQGIPDAADPVASKSYLNQAN